MSSLSNMRKQFCITQSELAKQVGVSVTTIQNIETLKKVPSVVLAMKIASIFNVSVESLFNDYITKTKGVESKNE